MVDIAVNLLGNSRIDLHIHSPVRTESNFLLQY